MRLVQVLGSNVLVPVVEKGDVQSRSGYACANEANGGAACPQWCGQSERCLASNTPSADDDFELPPKVCDKDRPEGCEGCQ